MLLSGYLSTDRTVNDDLLKTKRRRRPEIWPFQAGRGWDPTNCRWRRACSHGHTPCLLDRPLDQTRWLSRTTTKCAAPRSRSVRDAILTLETRSYQRCSKSVQELRYFEFPSTNTLNLTEKQPAVNGGISARSFFIFIALPPGQRGHGRDV